MNSPSYPRSASNHETWPGLYEFSYLSDKDELDKEEAGGLVPYGVEELSNKLFSVETLGNIDAREMLETIAQLDRTHTERTIFLQHRLARSYRLNQILRSNLDQAQDRLKTFETHVHELLEPKPESTAASRAELEHLAEQLEERLRMLPPRPALAIEAAPDREEQPISSPTQQKQGRVQLDEAFALLDEERAQLHEDRVQFEQEQSRLEQERMQLEQEQQHSKRERDQLAIERRDLEIRLAGAPNSDYVSRDEVENRIAHAVAITKESCLRDAEVRVAQAEKEAKQDEHTSELQAEVESLRAQLSDHQRESGETVIKLHAEMDALRTKLAEPNLTEALEAQVAELERMLDEAEAEASAAQELFRNQELERLETKTLLEERITELEKQVREGAQAVLQLSKAKQEAEAELTAKIHKQQKRMHALEHDVAHRGLELVKLEKQKEHLSKEALHFSLALSAKDQELQMLKRGTQNASAYWKVLGQRKVAERRALHPRSTNEPRKVSSEAAKRMVQDQTPRIELASTPNHVRREPGKRFPSVPSAHLPDLSTSTIDSVELSYRP